MFTNPEINAADAFVAAWLPGSQGAGVADVLVAGADGTAAKGFTGKLPFAWPADARSPVKTPQFAVGYGLTYADRSEEHTSELQSLMRISYAVFCLKKKNKQ